MTNLESGILLPQPAEERVGNLSLDRASADGMTSPWEAYMYDSVASQNVGVKTILHDGVTIQHGVSKYGDEGSSSGRNHASSQSSEIRLPRAYRRSAVRRIR